VSPTKSCDEAEGTASSLAQAPFLRPDIMKLESTIAVLSLVTLTACGVSGPDPASDEGAGGSGGDVFGPAAGVGGQGADPGPSGTGPGNGAGSGSGGNGGSGGGTGGGGGSDCPAGVICVDSYPHFHDGNTTGAASDQFDTYGCGSQNESGPEVLYRIEVPSEGFVWLDLSGLPAGVDVDVNLLGSLDPNDCLDRGNWDVGELVPAGQYFVSVDTWVDGNGVPHDGAYTLGVGLLTVQDLQSWGIDPSVAADALRVFDRAWTYDQVDTTAYAVVDFAVHAADERMWVFDVFEASLHHQTYTSVGDVSDPDHDGWADSFSNQSGSHMSSLGLMKGAELYVGSYGNSLRLDGLEPGYNDNVRDRAIVVHPWTGSAPAYVMSQPAGAAPTWGCLGIDPAIVDDLRTFLAGGGLILSHFPDGDWSANSTFLQ